MTILKRALALAAFGLAVAAAVPLGCRGVLGIHSLGDDALTCDAYCDAIGANCTGADLQYASRDLCMALCATFPVGTLTDIRKDTLGCRINMISKLNGQEGTCGAAGPAGWDPTGDQCAATACDAFCNSALQVCPMDFTSLNECLQVCGCLPLCGQPYNVPSGDAASCIPDFGAVQCRYYHLTAATLDPTDHCPHVRGMGYCAPNLAGCPDPNSCQTTSLADGGICPDGG
jgi:hypothetical protein